MKLSIAADAISADIETAVLVGLEMGIEHFELKRVHHKRIPDITEDEVRIVEKVLETHAVALSSLAPGLFKAPLFPDAVERELGTKFDRIVALADRLGTRSVVVFGFERDTSRSDASAVAEIIEIFGRAARRAEQEGVRLFLENDRGLWLEDPATLRRVVSEVGSDALRLNWDPCNLIATGHARPYPEGYAIVREFVGHMHLKDAAVGPEGQMVHAMMGSGDVDWVGQFEALYRDGYEGFCVIEPHFGSRIASSRHHILETRRLLRLARRRLTTTAPGRPVSDSGGSL